MLSKQLDDTTWLLQEGDTAFLVTTFYATPSLHVNIGIVDTDVVDLSTVVIEQEVWSGLIYTLCLDQTISALLQSFAVCTDPTYPFELAFGWGGQVQHHSPATSGYYLAQHAGTTLQ